MRPSLRKQKQGGRVRKLRTLCQDGSWQSLTMCRLCVACDCVIAGDWLVDDLERPNILASSARARAAAMSNAQLKSCLLSNTDAFLFVPVFSPRDFRFTARSSMFPLRLAYLPAWCSRASLRSWFGLTNCLFSKMTGPPKLPSNMTTGVRTKRGPISTNDSSDPFTPS
jgi:hypothetical protein